VIRSSKAFPFEVLSVLRQCSISEPTLYLLSLFSPVDVGVLFVPFFLIRLLLSLDGVWSAFCRDSNGPYCREPFFLLIPSLPLLRYPCCAFPPFSHFLVYGFRVLGPIERLENCVGSPLPTKNHTFFHFLFSFSCLLLPFSIRLPLLRLHFRRTL